MNIKIQIIIAIGILVALGIIVNMIRRKKLELRYALVWLAVGASILILDCFPELIAWLSEKVGIESPVNMLFFFGFCAGFFNDKFPCFIFISIAEKVIYSVNSQIEII